SSVACENAGNDSKTNATTYIRLTVRFISRFFQSTLARQAITFHAHFSGIRKGFKHPSAFFSCYQILLYRKRCDYPDLMTFSRFLVIQIRKEKHRFDESNVVRKTHLHPPGVLADLVHTFDGKQRRSGIAMDITKCAPVLNRLGTGYFSGQHLVIVHQRKRIECYVKDCFNVLLRLNPFKPVVKAILISIVCFEIEVFIRVSHDLYPGADQCVPMLLQYYRRLL